MSQWRVLVVEDEPDGQAVVTSLLSLHEIAADAVDNAEDALDTLRKTSYDAIVIDLMLPGMDGLELVRSIRRNPNTANTPCVAITAYHTSRVKHDAMSMGFDKYFPKPLNETGFVEALTDLLASRDA